MLRTASSAAPSAASAARFPGFAAVAIAIVVIPAGWRPETARGRATSPAPGTARPGSARRAAGRGRDLLLGRVLRRRFLDHRPDHRHVGVDPVRLEHPLLAVPLLDARRARALVVEAGDLERAHQVLEAEELDRGGVEV